MKEQRLVDRPHRRWVRTTQSNPSAAAGENVLAQKFEAETRDAVWVGDVTILDTPEAGPVWPSLQR